MAVNSGIERKVQPKEDASGELNNQSVYGSRGHQLIRNIAKIPFFYLESDPTGNTTDSGMFQGML